MANIIYHHFSISSIGGEDFLENRKKDPLSPPWKGKKHKKTKTFRFPIKDFGNDRKEP